MPNARTGLFLATLFVLMGAFETSAARAQDAAISRREKFLNLLLRGNDPITERAKERSSDRRRPYAVLPRDMPPAGSRRPDPSAGAGTRPTSTPGLAGARTVAPSARLVAPMILPAPSRRTPLAASGSSLERRAIRLTKQLARIDLDEEKLRLAYPYDSAAESISIRHDWMVLQPEQEETTAALNRVERQLASPTTPSLAVDALRLTGATRARLRTEPPAPKARRGQDIAKRDRRDR